MKTINAEDNTKIKFSNLKRKQSAILEKDLTEDEFLIILMDKFEGKK